MYSFPFIFYFRHVQVNNECAIEFYKKFGFEIVETRDQYYKRIEPAGAHVLQKTLRPKSSNATTGTTNTTTTTVESGNKQVSSTTSDKIPLINHVHQNGIDPCASVNNSNNAVGINSM